MLYSKIIDTISNNYIPVQINFKYLGKNTKYYIEKLQKDNKITINKSCIFRVKIPLKEHELNIDKLCIDDLIIKHITLDNTELSSIQKDYIIPLITSPLGLLEVVFNNLSIATFKKNYTHLAYFANIDENNSISVYFLPILQDNNSSKIQNIKKYFCYILSIAKIKMQSKYIV